MRKDLAELRKLQADRAEPSVPSKDLDALPGSEPTKGESTAPGVAIYIAQPVAAIAQPLPASPGQPTATRITTHVIHVAPLKFLSTAVLLSDEDATQFDDYLDSLFTEWQPQSVTKAIFVELFGVTTWRLGRLSRVDAELLEQYRFHNNVDGGLLSGFVHDVANMDCLSKVGECENKLRNSLSKILKELLN